MMLFNHLRKTVLPFIDTCKYGEETGKFRYSNAVIVEQPTLYSSTYAAMTYSLLGEMANICESDKKAWADYLSGLQDGDGLFRDPVIYGQGWYESDPLWCGRAHLTCHVITALGCLGYKAEKPFLFLKPYKDKDKLVDWLSLLDFGERVAWTGNEIMNVGTLLQYSRDFHADGKAGEAVNVLLEWLSSNHINPETGVWGSLDISDPVMRSNSVQAAYHWWPLFFYDKYPVPYIQAAIDTVLQTQNPNGGFGWGVHNTEEPYCSSACEDIDSIDPLVRMSLMTAYRRDDIAGALIKAKTHVLSNQTADGGFVFFKNGDFEYGHKQLFGQRNTGAMFPTWFRTLSLALTDTYICEINQTDSPYVFTNIPGFQFWQ